MFEHNHFNPIFKAVCARYRIDRWINRVILLELRPVQRAGDVNGVALCLLYDYHHDRIDHGWTIHTHDGIPWFTPPAFIEPTQTPLRNERH
jgi:hypothetical protein